MSPQAPRKGAARLTHVRQVRFTGAQDALLQRLSEVSGAPVSVLIRRLVVYAAMTTLQDVPAEWEQHPELTQAQIAQLLSELNDVWDAE